MRRILVESARSRRRLKRGGRRVRVELLDVAGSLTEDPDLLLSLDELLSRLAEEDNTASYGLLPIRSFQNHASRRT
jgi:hypothetical protein